MNSEIIMRVLIAIYIVMDIIYIHQLEKKVDALQSWVEFLLKRGADDE